MPDQQGAEVQSFRRYQVGVFLQNIQRPYPDTEQRFGAELAANDSGRRCELAGMEQQPENVRVVVAASYRAPCVLQERGRLPRRAWNVVDVVQGRRAVIGRPFHHATGRVGANPCSLGSAKLYMTKKTVGNPSDRPTHKPWIVNEPDGNVRHAAP